MAVKLTLREEYTAVDIGVENLETFMDACDVVYPAEEGVLADLVWNGPIVAILHRNDGTIKHLEPLVEECIKKITAAPDDKFGSKEGVTEFGDKGGYGVYSKYLCDQPQAAGAVAALKKATQYVTSINDPDKFDREKFEACFSGSCYVKKGKYSDDTLKGTGFWNLYQFPIQSRGWTKKEYFLAGLKLAKETIACMKKIDEFVGKWKDKKIDSDKKKSMKKLLEAARQTSDLCAHYGRGITVASKGVLRGFWGRLGQKMFGET